MQPSSFTVVAAVAYICGDCGKWIAFLRLLIEWKVIYDQVLGCPLSHRIDPGRGEQENF